MGTLVIKGTRKYIVDERTNTETYIGDVNAEEVEIKKVEEKVEEKKTSKKK